MFYWVSPFKDSEELPYIRPQQRLLIYVVRWTIFPISTHMNAYSRHTDQNTDVHRHALVASHKYTHTHGQTHWGRAQYHSVYKLSTTGLSAFILPKVGCPICSTTGNINRPTIVFKEINTREYCFSPSLPSFLSFTLDPWSLFI